MNDTVGPIAEITEEAARIINAAKAEGIVLRLLGGLRQIIETIYDKLLNTFRLGRERPHDLTGFQARLT
jgi:hypothetical protein